MAESEGFLHLARPIGPSAVGIQPSAAPLQVVIQPQALFSIIDHASRRPLDQPRVIGTLLGTRSDSDESHVIIHSSFAVPHTETTDQVEVDMEYQKAMLALHLKANPKEILVGCQGEGTFPHPAVHVTVSCQPGSEVEVRTYISSPVGVTPERAADSAAFIPVPFTLNYSEADRAGLDVLLSAKDDESRTTTLLTDIETLERSLVDTLSMLDRVAKYVENVIEEEEEKPSVALGQFLLNALALAPKVDPADVERDFNNHIQDVLTVSYLANTVRTQMDLSNRLATAQLTLGGIEGNIAVSAEKGEEAQGAVAIEAIEATEATGGGGRGQRQGQNRQTRGESVSMANI